LLSIGTALVVLATMTPAWGAPAASFTWSRPDRYRDTSGDGFRDSATTSEDISAPFTVRLSACGSSGDGSTITQYQWRSAAFTPVDTAECAITVPFAAEGSYSVQLTILTSGGNATVTHPVTVNDLLVVSLGDSYASGEGNPHSFGYPEIGLPLPIDITWEDRICHRSAYAGPAQAAAWLEEKDPKTSVTFVHLACSGAKIEDQELPGDVRGPYNNVQPALGGLLDPYEGQEVTEWLHPPTFPAQVDAAAALTGARPVDAMTVSIGGNDVQFAGIVKDCIVNVIGCHIDSDAPPNPDGIDILDQYLPLLSARYDRLAQRLQSQFGSRLVSDDVFMTEYPDPTRCNDGGVCSMIPGVITRPEGIWASGTVLPQLNGIMADAATNHGWTYVDGISAGFKNGHGYAADDSWLISLPRSIFQQGSKDGAFHPNVAGHTWYRNRILAKIGPQLAPQTTQPTAAIASDPFELPVGVAAPDFTTDRDSDLLPDLFDNCPRVFNPTQKDQDKNAIGDDCGFTITDKELATDSDLDDPTCSSVPQRAEGEPPPLPKPVNMGPKGKEPCAIGAAIAQSNETGQAQTGDSTGNAGNFLSPGTYQGPGETIVNGLQLDATSTPITNNEVLTRFEIPIPRCQALLRRPCVTVEGAGFNISSSGVGLYGMDIVGPISVTGSPDIDFLGNWMGGHPEAPTIPQTRLFLYRVSGRIGGPAWWQRNVISGANAGIEIFYTQDTPLVIEGNYIGTDVKGVVANPNLGKGIELTTHGFEVAGANPLIKGNVIAGNAGDGISTAIPGDAPAVIVGNKIGLNAQGNPLGNGGFGIYNNGTIDVWIGGTGAGQGNQIAFNAKGGIQLQSGVEIPILGNTIWGNGSTAYPGALGINLAQDCCDISQVLNNDPGDTDGAETSGIGYPNQGQNFPVLTGVALNEPETATIINTTLDAHPSTAYTVELFANPGGCEPSRHGEGEIFLKRVTLTTQSTGIGGLAVTVNQVLDPATVVTATATDPNGNTSEFSMGVARVGRCGGTFQVNDAGNAGDGQTSNGVCDTGTTAAPTGDCTLRAAMQQANAVSGVDKITFEIGTGAATITPATNLPGITEAVVIDGTTQPGFDGSPLVRLDGSLLGGGGRGLEFNSAGSIVRGLSVTNFGSYGIIGLNAPSLWVTGNYIGLQPDGVTTGLNDTGVYLLNSADSTIGGTAAGEGNVISGNDDGIRLVSGSSNDGIVVQGNLIGTDPSGATAIANTAGITTAAPNSLIGGTAQGAGNLISGNTGAGVWVSGTAAGILGNRIGTDASGTAALGNGTYGVALETSGHHLGGTLAGAANTIAFNGGTGVDAVTGNIVRGNSIHTNGGPGLAVRPSGSIPLVAAPTLSRVDGLDLTGWVTGAPGSYAVEVFANDGPCSSATEARTLVKRVTATIGASGVQAPFSVELPVMDATTALTAIAIRDTANTSPLSACLLNADITAPRGVAIAALDPVQTSLALPLSLAGADGAGVQFQVQARTARWDAGTFTAFAPITTTTNRTYVFHGTAGTSVCFRARGTDEWANQSAWSAQRCTTFPLDDVALNGSRWNRDDDALSYRGTISKAQVDGATLTRAGASATQLAVVVTRCAECGALKVKWKGTLLATVDLRSSTTRRRVVVVLDKLSNPGSGAVELVATPQGAHPARVDGLAIIRR
jgi:hypothetical protein